MDVQNIRDGPGTSNGSQGRIGPLTSTPEDQRPPERDLAFIDDTESLGSQQTGKDREGLSAPPDDSETKPSPRNVQSASYSISDGGGRNGTSAGETLGSSAGSAPVVWESPRRQEGRFSVLVRVVCLPDGGERAECLKWLAFGGDQPPWRTGGDPGG